MLEIRETEESFVEPILNRTVSCPVHLYSGEEAIAVGISAHLNHRDNIFGNHRSHGHYLAKGGSLKGMIAEIYCREEGCSKGRGGSMHLIDPEVGMLGSAPIVAGTISLSLGAALAAKNRKDKSVAVAYFGDGATGEGVLFESMNFAALKKLPLLFVCENNLYSTHMSIDEIRTNRNISEIARSFDMKSYKIEGNDLAEVYDVAKEAIEYMREGFGPVFIEALTYRQRGHVGPDDNIQGSHTDIRPAEEVKMWLDKDPIKQFEKYLEQDGQVSSGELSTIREEIKNQVKEYHQWALESAKPSEGDLKRDVFKK